MPWVTPVCIFETGAGSELPAFVSLSRAHSAAAVGASVMEA
jgi:hypothetical protein